MFAQAWWLSNLISSQSGRVLYSAERVYALESYGTPRRSALPSAAALHPRHDAAHGITHANVTRLILSPRLDDDFPPSGPIAPTNGPRPQGLAARTSLRSVFGSYGWTNDRMDR